ncbi:DUF2723 domain-containing protein [Pseudomonas sp. RIT-PI-S]|uniref:DUF2723 domain-containing protein n=1 Tax=Pseudomonas sp. RIT-PI-S TaxID=3035295 RepID=UPI0021D86222|nr:DUF2723 domain-containing protein [Pseudomonas sp. RIT-PI-S]
MRHGHSNQLKGPWPLLLLGAAILASFLASSGPVQWMDNGMFLADATIGRYFSETLGPLEHPLYQFFNTLVFEAFGTQVLSLLNSILLVPLAAAVYWLSRNLGAQRNLALLAATVAVLCHAVFWVSTKAEVYIFHALFVVLAYALYFERRSGLGATGKLLVIGLFTGMAASIHQLTFVVLMPLYLRLLVEQRARILLTVPAFVIGFVTAYPAMFNDLDSGLSLIQIGRHYLTGASPFDSNPNWEGSMLRFDAMWHEKNSVALLCLSLIGPQALGLVLFPKDRKLRLVWWALLLNFVFAASYNVNDRFTFFLPGAAFAAILGVLRLRDLLPDTRAGAWVLGLSALCSPAALLAMWVLYANGAVPLPVHSEALPYRNDIHYFMVPYLRDRSAEEFAHYYEASAPAGALIVSDWTPMGALRSAQAAGELQGRTFESCDNARDLSLYLQGAGAFLPRTSYCDGLKARYRLEKLVVGYQLQGK